MPSNSDFMDFGYGAFLKYETWIVTLLWFGVMN
jgi:hypothetical protein